LIPIAAVAFPRANEDVRAVDESPDDRASGRAVGSKGLDLDLLLVPQICQRPIIEGH
jgi:hypothetical protein